MPVSEQEKLKDILEAGPDVNAKDLKHPELDVSRRSCFRCLCRCLSLNGCLCRCLKRCCRGMWCCKVCKQSRTERMFEAGREFYTNEVSVQRLVQAMQLVEMDSNDPESTMTKKRGHKSNNSSLQRIMEQTDSFCEVSEAENVYASQQPQSM